MCAYIIDRKKSAVLTVVIFYLCQTGVLAQPTCSKSLEPEPITSKEKREDGLTYNDDSVLMCSDNKCGKLSLAKIKTAYTDVFSSKSDAEKGTGFPYNDYADSGTSSCLARANETPSATSSLISTSCGRFWSDRDQCCPTWRYITFYRGPLRNISGRKCYILQLPYFGLYQYISVGRCGFPQRCRGRCTQQYTIQSMLAWCPGLQGLQMHHFRIPTYCSCQSVLRG